MLLAADAKVAAVCSSLGAHVRCCSELSKILSGSFTLSLSCRICDFYLATARTKPGLAVRLTPPLPSLIGEIVNRPSKRFKLDVGRRTVAGQPPSPSGRNSCPGNMLRENGVS
ncbi:hypothetical protein AAHA92_22195 [Salvia divinorum]|uniref:Uncharacterized protein n=1 Tax=Salvia divinorum TaxID=28513 RepID=A0ABD1GMX1_SALDI